MSTRPAISMASCQRWMPREPLFDYDDLRLPNPKKYIRLLKVVNANTTPIRCQLSVHSLSDLPPFEAISYTWGDSAPEVCVIINGKRKAVGLSCESALFQAQCCGQKSYLWIDALCINQKDDLEKSSQVNMMGSIYNAAVCTLACLGHKVKDWDILLSFVKRNDALLQKLSEKIPQQRDLVNAGIYSLDDLPLGVIKIIISWLSCKKLQTDPQHIDQIFKTMDAIMSNPYFQRLWVLQELFCAKEVLFCCGESYETAQAFYRFSLLVHVLEVLRVRFSSGKFPKDHKLSRQLRAKDLAVLQLFNWSRLPEFAWCRFWHATFQFAIQDYSEKYSLLALFNRHIYHQKCRDPRDLIYGLLSLVNWDTVPGKALFPDYGKSLVQVVTETYVLLVKHDKTKATGQNLHSRVGEVETALLQGFTCAIFNIATKSRPSLSKPLPDDQTQFQYACKRKRIPNCAFLKIIFINGKWTFDIPGQQIPGDHVRPTTCANNGGAADATPQQPYYSMLNSKGGVSIYFSRHTRSGDWLLIGEHSFRPGAVIARRSEADGTFQLVSQVAFKGRSEYDWVVKSASQHRYRAEMSFDVEDYVVYMMRGKILFDSLSERRVGRRLPSLLPKLLNRHVCRFQGSSFAICKKLRWE